MDDAQQIDRLIEVMQQLKELELMYAESRDFVIMSLMMALIHTVQIPNVTILSNNKPTMAQA
jgi:hypothetical protein|tara:strand:- start:3723 stop:3908 length:186 start_codon:yes stop_codon:yes gene_type:complete